MPFIIPNPVRFVLVRMPLLTVVSPVLLTVMVSFPASPLIVSCAAMLLTVLLSLKIWILSSFMPVEILVVPLLDLTRMLSAPAPLLRLV